MEPLQPRTRRLTYGDYDGESASGIGLDPPGARPLPVPASARMSSRTADCLRRPNETPQLLARLQLDLRGVRFSVDREKIMNLPESVLLCLFPNGLVLSRQSVAGSSGYDEEEGEDVYIVDVSVHPEAPGTR